MLETTITCYRFYPYNSLQIKLTLLMNYVSLIIGIIVLTGAICELAYTTFSSNGAGYLTNAFTKGIWHLSLRLCKKDGSKRILEYVGIFTIGTVVMSWFLLVWLGSTLIISSDPNSVIDALTNEKASIMEKAYFTGYTLTTLGIGDYKPAGNVWRIFTVILSFSGFMLISTAVSYMLPVLSADVFKKRLSKKIRLLGKSPQEILLNNWKDGNFKGLETYFNDLTDMIISHSQQLLAYPILYSFHNTHLEKSSTLSIAVLDEALTILLVHVPEQNRPSDRAIGHLRKAIATFLNILDKNFIYDSQTYPSFPQIDQLEKAGIPLMNQAHQIKESYNKISRRRHLIGIMLSNEGWKFSDIDRLESDPEQEI